MWVPEPIFAGCLVHLCGFQGSSLQILELIFKAPRLTFVGTKGHHCSFKGSSLQVLWLIIAGSLAHHCGFQASYLRVQGSSLRVLWLIFEGSQAHPVCRKAYFCGPGLILVGSKAYLFGVSGFILAGSKPLLFRFSGSFIAFQGSSCRFSGPSLCLSGCIFVGLVFMIAGSRAHHWECQVPSL